MRGLVKGLIDTGEVTKEKVQADIQQLKKVYMDYKAQQTDLKAVLIEIENRWILRYLFAKWVAQKTFFRVFYNDIEKNTNSRGYFNPFKDRITNLIDEFCVSLIDLDL